MLAVANSHAAKLQNTLFKLFTQTLHVGSRDCLYSSLRPRSTCAHCISEPSLKWPHLHDASTDSAAPPLISIYRLGLDCLRTLSAESSEVRVQECRDMDGLAVV